MSLRVIAFVPYPTAGASARYRVFQLIEGLAALGVRLDVRPFHDERAFSRLYGDGGVTAKAFDLARGGVRRWRDLREARRFDLALIHRDVWPLAGDAPLRRLAAAQPRWVYDFDDAVFLPNISDANRRFAALKPARQYDQLVSGASAVAAGNAWLADWARRERPGRDPGDVETIPTAVDTVAWQPRPRNPGPPRLVWIGSHSTAAYLAPLRPVLERLARRHPELELHVIGARFRVNGMCVVEHPWTLSSEIGLTADCDIGLAPLPDNDWSRGKCGLKLLLYLSLGLAAVASPVGVQRGIIRDRENGLLAETPEAFQDALEALLVDPQYRERLGRAGRATVESAYSVRSVVPRLAALLERAAARP